MDEGKHDCEHREVTQAGNCIECGEQVILTGQVPVSGNDPECNHVVRCCPVHQTHANPHLGCILR